VLNLFIILERTTFVRSSFHSSHFLRRRRLVSSRFNGHTLPRAGKVVLVASSELASHSALEHYSGGRPVPRAQSFPTAGTYKHADVYMPVRELPFILPFL